MITEAQKQFYDLNGYLIMKQLFTKEEVEMLIDHYMELRHNDPTDVDLSSSDPLKRYPRLLQMHRYDPISLNFLIDSRNREVLTDLAGREPLAVQTMMYFKPPKARGQALHQDQLFLQTQPGTCIAAWMALDPCDTENGCLEVVPGSQDWPLLCTIKANTEESFTDITVPIPEGTEVRPVIMEPGDVLFFNGQIVHGSYPNQSKDRFRRSLIAHYVEGEAQQVAQFYHPVLRFDESVVELGLSDQGGTCGVWVDKEGKPEIELSGSYGPLWRTE